MQCASLLVLGMASDTVLRLTTLPRLMWAMLTTDGWRRLVRPVDQRVFENAIIDAWVLGEPWPGLHFPDSATVYALLGKNVEVGQECITRLQGAKKRQRRILKNQNKTVPRDGARACQQPAVC